MKKKLISQILSGAISVEELDDSSIGGEPNATVDDSKIPAAGTDSTATGTETTPAEVPATDPKPEDDVDGDATQAAPEDGAPATTGAEEPPAATEPPTDAEPPATDAAGATEPGADAGAEEPPADTATTADGDAAGATEPPADDPATAGDATAAATDGGTEDAGAPPATEEPPVDDPSVASLGDEAGASGPAAGETGEPELDENGEPVKKEPSPDAEVTPLPEGVDPEAAEEESNIDEDTLEDEEEIEESEEDIIAKADAVADLTNAQTSLEELAAEIESTIQDGGLTPEGVVAAQGAANDILNEVKEEPIGLPSQESFGTFEGRRANTIITVESIGDKVKAVGSRAMEILRNVLASLRKLFNFQRTVLNGVAKAAEQKMKAEYPNFNGATLPITGDVVKGLCVPATTKDLDARYFTKQAHQFTVAKTRLEGIVKTVEQATANGKIDSAVIAQNKDIDTTLEATIERVFDSSLSDITLVSVGQDCLVKIGNVNDLRAVYNAAKNCAQSAVDFIDHTDRKVVGVERSLAKIAKQSLESEERQTVSYVSASLVMVSRLVRANGRYAKTLYAVANRAANATAGAEA